MPHHNKETDIITWAERRGILPHASRMAQAEKTREEVQELIEAIAADDLDAIRDAIGDIYVTIVIQAAANNMSLTECTDAAWDEIKDRTGRMIDGQFVKD